MTYEEFILQLSQLEVNREYSYIPSEIDHNANTYKLLRVAHDAIGVENENQEISIPIDHIKSIVDALRFAEPLDVEATLGGGDNIHSIIESLFCLTPSIFYTRIQNRIHIVMLSRHNHPLGELASISERDLNEARQQQRLQNRRDVENGYINYLTNVARSERTGRPLSPAAVANYKNFLQCNRLFDYAPARWANIENIYDVTSVEEIENIIELLNNDDDFRTRNREDNQGFRSKALLHYKNYLLYRGHLGLDFRRDPALDNAIVENEQVEEQGLIMSVQKIFYGAPGTGKSFKINQNELSGIDKKNTFRTTFHPDYDYAQFVGAYKPKKVPAETNAEGVVTRYEISYEFVPQVFAKAYVAAWTEYLQVNEPGDEWREDATKKLALVIEEINRGNCAQIFGDIFQLLDRKKGHSEYPIDVDADFAEYVEKNLTQNGVWDKYKEQILKWIETEADVQEDSFCKIALPPNLIILATMNTSDQSLFPVDSAFKRRFDWEYVPINYEHPDANFAIKIGESVYSWLEFLKSVNAAVYKVTKSEDKQMGEFFIKPKDGLTIGFDEFRSKVLFYLWDSVYKDEVENDEVTVFKVNNTFISFQSLFEGRDPEQKNLVKQIMANLQVRDRNVRVAAVAENQNQPAIEPGNAPIAEPPQD